MGVVRDGTTSGILPNNEEFVVHYPGYPSSASQAVQTLERAERIMKLRDEKPEAASSKTFGGDKSRFPK